MNKIRTLSTYVLYCLNCLLITIPIFTFLSWYYFIFAESEFLEFFMDNGFSFIADDFVNVKIWSFTAKIISLVAYIIGALPIFIGLFFLRRIFLNYKTGEVFNVINSRYYKYIGWAFFLDALIAKPIDGGLMSVATTLSNPVGERLFTITFDTLNLEAIFYGLIMIVIAQVMLEAAKIKEEQQYIV